MSSSPLADTHTSALPARPTFVPHVTGMIDPVDVDRVTSAGRGVPNLQMHHERQVKAKAIEDVVNRNKEEKKGWFYTVYATQIGLAVAASVLTGALLYIFNPPITQCQRDDPYTQEKQSVKKVLLFCGIVLFAVFIIPDVLILLHVFERQ